MAEGHRGPQEAGGKDGVGSRGVCPSRTCSHLPSSSTAALNSAVDQVKDERVQHSRDRSPSNLWMDGTSGPTGGQTRAPGSRE